MCKPCWFLNESFGTSDAGSTENANTIVIEIEIEDAEGEAPNFTSPNSPH